MNKLHYKTSVKIFKREAALQHLRLGGAGLTGLEFVFLPKPSSSDSSEDGGLFGRGLAFGLVLENISSSEVAFLGRDFGLSSKSLSVSLTRTGDLNRNHNSTIISQEEKE